MKPEHSIPMLSPKDSHRFVFALLGTLLLVGGPVLARAENAGSEPKEYSLFVGGNLEIPQGKDFIPVQRLVKTNFEVVIDKSLKKVPVQDIDRYRVAREIKLGALSANIEIKRTERFEEGAARRRLDELSKSVTVQAVMEDRQSLALGKLTRASMSYNAPTNSGGTTTPGSSDRDQKVGAAMNDIASAFRANDITNGAWVAKKAVDSTSDDIDDTNNALDLAFDVSSPRHLTNAYVVLVTEFHAPRKADTPSSIITPKFIGDIGPKSVNVSLEQQGFPAGFVIDKVNLFLYSNNTEIATNYSADRRDLTRDQAFKYLLVQYIASHSKDNRAPTPIMGAAPANYSIKADDAFLSQSVVITINKNGEVVSVVQEDSSVKIPHPVEVALKAFRFFPALKEGLPAEGLIKVRLSSLFQSI